MTIDEEVFERIAEIGRLTELLHVAYSRRFPNTCLADLRHIRRQTHSLEELILKEKEGK